MARRKAAKNVEIKPWLSARKDCREGRFIQVGNSLLLSRDFQKLTSGARVMYLALCMESGGGRETTFTHGDGKKYGIKKTSFDRHIKELCDAGFIERVEDENLMQYTPSAFRFSLAWRTEAAPHFGEGKGRNIPQNGEGTGCEKG